MFKRLKNYFVNAYRELHKVSWLTRKQVISHSIIVIVTILLVAAFIAGWDFLFQRLYQYLINNFS